jgi:hypothetical protein
MNLPDPRTPYIATLLLLPAVAVVNSFLHRRQLASFLRQTPAIATYQDIVAFEKTVARQMYAALLQIALLVAPWIVFGYGFVQDVLTVDDLGLVIAPSFVVLALGLNYKRLENRARSIRAEDPTLGDRRDHIVEVWMRKPFPDW